MKGVEINSTLASLEDFKQSVIWQDITNELKMWKEGFSNELGAIVSDAEESNPSTATVLLHLGDLNGRIKAVDYMLQIIDVFITYLEEKADGSGHNPAD